MNYEERNKRALIIHLSNKECHINLSKDKIKKKSNSKIFGAQIFNKIVALQKIDQNVF